MTWLKVAAFAGLIAVAVPILVHLLARRKARAQAFPTLRFIGTARAVSPSRARLSDAALLAVRIGIVAAAVAALAQPLWLSAERRSQAGRASARVIIVDTSASVHRATPDGESGIVAARREAARLAAEPGVNIVVESLRPAAELGGASELLSASMAGAREIVVVSDFQFGTIDPADVAQVSDAVGVRFVRLAVDTNAIVPGATPVAGEAEGRIQALAGEDERRAADATLSAALIGIPRETTNALRSVAVVFPGYPNRDALSQRPAAGLEPWMGDVAWRVRHDSAVVARGDAGGTDALLLVSRTDAGTLAAATLIRNAANALAAERAPGEFERGVVPDSLLRTWERPAASGDAIRAGALDGLSDGRWLWLLALALIVVEQIVRSTRRSPLSGEAGDVTDA